MRGSEGLVQVQVHHVKSHVSGTRPAHHGVEVGAVVVAQAARLMHDARDFQNVGIEQAHGIGIGQHQRGRIGSRGLAQLFQIHQPVCVAGDAHHLIAAHGRAGGIGAMRRVRHKHLGASLVAPALMVRLDKQQAHVLPMRARGGLEGHAVHASDGGQAFLGLTQHLAAAARRGFGLERMHAGKARQGRHVLVDAGVVFHGAAAQGIEPLVYAVHLLGQRFIVAGQLALGQFRQIKRGLARKFLRQRRGGHVRRG